MSMPALATEQITACEMTTQMRSLFLASQAQMASNHMRRPALPLRQVLTPSF